METSTLPRLVTRTRRETAGVEAAVGAVVEPSIHLVRRPRLEHLLADRDRRPLTLLCAPPGSGKTTLVASWFHQRAGSGSWITADASSGDEFEDAVESARTRGGVLVIDDAHNLGAPQLRLLDALLVDLIRDVHLVVSSRADLPLGLARLRLDSRVREIRASGLAFTVDEAGELLRQRGVRIGNPDVRRLHARTEGWAAGLRLMHYALEQGATPTSLADDGDAASAAVSDYLVAEVLDRVDEGTRSFLLRTSIAERLTPDLAVVLADDPSGGALLEDLQRRGMFVVGPEQGWYRYHSLFAGLLRARLRLENPVLVNDLHRRAADWFALHERYRDAEAHSRAGEQWPMLGQLVLRRWRKAVLAGSFNAAPHESLPESALESDPVLALLSPPGRIPIRAEASGLAGEVAVVSRLRACELGNGADVLPGRPRDAELRPIVDVLELELLVAADRLDDAIRAAADRGAGPAWTHADAGALVALVLALRGEVKRALVVRNEALRWAEPGVGRLIQPVSALVAALTDAQRGQPVSRADVESLTSVYASWVVRACARTVLGCRSPESGVYGLDPQQAHHPFVGRVLVALGALDVVDRTGHAVSVGGDAEHAVRHARRCLEHGSTHAAGLSALSAMSVPDAHSRTATEAAVIVAAVEGTTHAVHAALERAAAALTWAPFVTHRSRIRPHVERAARNPGPHQVVAIRVLELVDDHGAEPVIAPLTDREHAVLRLLPTMMSNEEIASALYLSVNTVKTHLRALYRKLGVNRRRDAVVRARGIGLLDRV